MVVQVSANVEINKHFRAQIETYMCCVNLENLISYLNTGLITHLMWPNDARPINSRMQVSANCGGSNRSSVGLSGVASSLLAYLKIHLSQ